MVVDLYSESSSMGTTSPRISFSHDFCQSDVVPVEHHPLRSNSIDFDFCVREGFDQESSSADELFSDGKILPTQIKKKAVAIATTKPMDQCGSHHHPPLPLPRTTTTTTTSGNKSTSKQESPKENSKSFWRFTRSSSCGSGYGRSLCPLPPLLSRSNSTGSAVNSRQSSQKHASMKASQSSASAAAAAAGGYPRPPLKKGIHGSYGNINGVRISPVLNVPPANNLFGLGSIFSSSGRDKNRKK
ncbi:uncharacterized protein LOC132182461 [Corylus avellana]|uniref:uncharacterized protein LOC132182461 n=1 Tax=Corylus avellana TaxID=13451 RepID=UPI00286B26A1|nr:uncharacterized protein LOC132182461 [Corylus avellana]